MKILFAASEAVPFCKTGGLADVVGALASSLKKTGQDVRLVIPKYRAVDAAGFVQRPETLRVLVGDRPEPVRLWESQRGGVKVILVDSPRYFDREGLYHPPGGPEFVDNHERFILFSRAVLETAKAINFRPDIVHAHDWQTALICAYLKTVYSLDAYFLGSRSVLSIHNLAYQGVFPKSTVPLAGFSWLDFNAEHLEFFDHLNFLKAGLVYADRLTTVSPTYAEEVCSSVEFGRGMEGVLSRRAREFVGILNGLDTHAWNPQRDPFLVQRFTQKSLGKRAFNKADLQAQAGWPPDPQAPLLGVVTRLDAQKGVDMLLEILPRFLQEGCQAVVLGQGDPVLQKKLEGLMNLSPHRFFYHGTFNDPLAHKIYAGADLFLMPSRFEPCGLSQMIALRYGAVPVVTPTGGLKDTVQAFHPDANSGWGFVAHRATSEAFADVLKGAIAIYRQRPDAWAGLQTRGMARDFSWSRSVEKYLELYRAAKAISIR